MRLAKTRDHRADASRAARSASSNPAKLRPRRSLPPNPPTAPSPKTAQDGTRLAAKEFCRSGRRYFLYRRFAADWRNRRGDAEMARTLQAAALPRIETRQLPAGAALAALGIVYGDIGTSALYGFKQAAEAGGTLSPATIMGIVSVIL